MIQAQVMNRRAVSMRAEKFSTLPWPYGWDSSAGRSETLTATRVTTAATRSSPEWAASARTPSDALRRPTTSFMPVNPRAAMTELRAARFFSLRARSIVASSVDMGRSSRGRALWYHVLGGGSNALRPLTGPGAWSIFAAHGRRLPGPAPVRSHRRISFSFPADDARAVPPLGHHRGSLRPDEKRGLQAPVRLSRQDPRDRVRHGGRLGDRPRIRVRQQLGGLFEDGRGHFRRSARRRGRVLVLPRIRVPGHPRL